MNEENSPQEDASSTFADRLRRYKPLALSLWGVSKRSSKTIYDCCKCAAKWPFNPTVGDVLGLLQLRLAGFISLFFVALILLMGMASLRSGSREFFGIDIDPGFHIEHSATDAASKERAVSQLIMSLEFFLLAPLCYLQLRTLGNYIQDLIRNKGVIGSGATEALHTVKALSTGLLIALLATNLVGDLIVSVEQPKTPDAHESAQTWTSIIFSLLKPEADQFPLLKMLIGSLLIWVLSSYYRTLESIGHKHVETKTEDRPSPSTAKSKFLAGNLRDLKSKVDPEAVRLQKRYGSFFSK